MRSSDRRRAVAAALGVAASLLASSALAQQAAQGFATERLYLSAPGGGWFVMDALDMHGGLGGAMALTTGYAMKPLQVASGGQSVSVVSDQALVDFGFALTCDALRLYLNFEAPLAVEGRSGAVGGYSFTGPGVDLGQRPDTLSDARLGFDARIVGGPSSPFRFGLGGQLFVPNGLRSDYLSDGTYRGMLRALVAGDEGDFTYAAEVGLHIRPLDDTPVPGSPEGSELLFGAAAGTRFRLGRGGGTALVVGPEVFGETALAPFWGSRTTGVEAMMTGRVEGTGDDGRQLRVKLATGGGLDQRFGAPEWRVVFGLEVFDHSTDRDHDGVTDSLDACPDTPGVKTSDPKTNGCPAPVPMETDYPG